MAIHTVSFHVPDTIDQVCAQEALAAVLYYNGKLSEKEARMMIGKTRREFQEEIKPKYSLSMIGGTHEDIDIEKNTILHLS